MKRFMHINRIDVKRPCRVVRYVVFSFSLLWLLGSSHAHPAPNLKLDTIGAPKTFAQVEEKYVLAPPILFFCIGDSLSHGTMDATNNEANTLNAYVQLIVDALADKIPLYFQQPLFDDHENRVEPFVVPTNLGVDGSDIFSVMGLEYYKRIGANESFISRELLADRWLPSRLKDTYDRVLYPINLLVKKPVSQLSAARWLLKEKAPKAGITEALGILWEGNNDSSIAALGTGGLNPMFQPLPFDVVRSELKPALRTLSRFGELTGKLSFEPYTMNAIRRNLTEINDFTDQYELVVNMLDSISASPLVNTDVLLLTLPYYSAVGYLMDSEDIEFYLQKLNSEYTVPATFKRVTEPGDPITDPLQGDRISLLTFGLMYVLLSGGHSIDDVNRAIETDGLQRDGLVLSEAEQEFIMSRIDAFNEAIKNAAASSGLNFHVIDIGKFLNDTLSGKLEIVVAGRVLSRKWIRGNAFSFDGVHPGYVGQALIANVVLEHLNGILGLNADLYNLSAILANDPYIDQDGDGWAPGPQYTATGITELLFLFKDQDDNDPQVQVELPPDVWDLISDVLLKEILNVPEIRAEAMRLGIVSEY